MKRWMLAAVLFAMGCQNGATVDQCSLLLDHLVDLEFKKAGVAEANKAELAKQKQAVSQAKATEFLETCSSKTSKTRIECAIAAPDLDAVARCDEAK